MANSYKIRNHYNILMNNNFYLSLLITFKIKKDEYGGISISSSVSLKLENYWIDLPVSE